MNTTSETQRAPEILAMSCEPMRYLNQLDGVRAINNPSSHFISCRQIAVLRGALQLIWARRTFEGEANFDASAGSIYWMGHGQITDTCRDASLPCSSSNFGRMRLMFQVLILVLQ